MPGDRIVCVELDKALCVREWTPNVRAARFEAPEAVAKLRAKGWKVYVCTRHLWEASEDRRAEITRWLAHQRIEVDGLYALPPAGAYLMPRAFGAKFFSIVDFADEVLFDQEEAERERIREEARLENEAALAEHRAKITKRFRNLVDAGMPTSEAAQFMDSNPTDEAYLDKLSALTPNVDATPGKRFVKGAGA